MDDWKGLRLGVANNPESPWQLYNLKNDMGETTDVSAQHPELIARFKKIQDAEHQNSHLNEWEFFNSKMVKKQN